MILYLWDAPPRCGVSGSLEGAQETAGNYLASGGAPSARVEAARLSTGLLSYVRTDLAWQARHNGSVITWELLTPETQAPRRITRK